MRHFKSLSLAISIALAGCSNQYTETPSPNSLKQLQTTQSLLSLDDAVSVNHATLVKNTDEQSSFPMHVRFQSQKHAYSNVVIEPKTPFDWSHYDDVNIAFTLSNPGEHSVQLYLDVTDIHGDTYTRTTSVAKGSKNKYYAKISGHDLAVAKDQAFNDLNFTSGLRSNPDTWASSEIQFTSMWGNKNLDLSGIKRISLSVQHAMFDKEIIIHDMQLRPNPPMDPLFLTNIVDQYGQNAKQEFAYKIHNDEELLNQRDKEFATFTNRPLEHYSRFSGWKNGPKVEGTGYFTTKKHNGKWYLLDPEGYLYFATGLDIIRLSNSTTMTGYDFTNPVFEVTDDAGVTPEDSKGLNRVSNSALDRRFVAAGIRTNMFEWLPEYTEPLGKHYGYRASAHSGPLTKGETFSFYSANLERKYADLNPDFLSVWRDVTIKRMLDWGFTSLGNWTDPSYYQNTRIPFFANGWIIGDYKTISSGNDFWAPLPDVFDPKFTERTYVTVRQIAKEVQNTPWCVGVFIDNEKSFGRSETAETEHGIVLHTLGRNAADVPTKAAFSKYLKNKYESIEALNQVWDTNIASWAEFDQGYTATINNPAQLEDYGELLFLYADKYFSTVAKVMDEIMPNHMYLGSRLADWGMPKQVIKAAAKNVDVMSYNVYKEGLHPSKWGFLADLDMPSIIGEFHNGALDSGLFHPGLIHASDQEDRGKMYQDYMRSVIDNPYFVGAHWFQYIDSPITGRAHDGENYNVGFVTVADTPYTPLVDAAREINQAMYKRRSSEQ